MHKISTDALDLSRDGSVVQARTSVSPSSALGIGFAWVIVELAPDGVLVSDENGEIVMVNRQIEDMFGYGRDTLIGASVENLLPVRSRHAHRVHRARFTDAPRTRPMGAGLELFGLHADGTEFPVEISLSAVAVDHGPVTVVVIRDLRQRRAVAQAAHLTSVIDEDERIGRALEDRVIGHLFGCGLGIAAVLSHDGLDDGIAERLRDVIDEIDIAVRDIRKTIFTRLGDATL